MRRSASLLFLSAVMFVAGCTSLPPVKVRTWEVTDERRVYPERDGDYQVPWLDEKRDVGVVFSGGGTRSAAATLGQLRALRCLGWLDSARYVSAVSGGSWAAVPYTYLRPGTEKQFLGEYVPPKQLTDAHLRHAPVGSLTRAMDGAFPFWGAVSHMIRLRGDESYAASLGDIFLRPFGLGDRRKFFASHSEALAKTLEANDSNLTADDFLLPQRGRPYLIVGATLIGDPRSGDRKDLFSVEMTPLYTGMVGVFPDPRDDNRVLGGGFVESFGYDSHLPPQQQQQGDRKVVDIGLPRYRMTLSDVIGASGAAPQAALVRWLVEWIGFPEFRQWPIDGRHGERETHFGDGGHVDNIGLMPLLARKVSNILVFVNTATPFETKMTDANDYHLYGDLVNFFRAPYDKADGKTSVQTSDPNFRAAADDDPSRVVIESGAEELTELYDAFKKARDATPGQPLVHCDKYRIKDNPRFGVTSYDASICWVYLDRTDAWINDLDVKKNPNLEHSIEAREFPHYNTFFARGLQVIRLKPADVNTLSNLTAWTVLSQNETIGKALGLPTQKEPACSGD